MKAMSESKKKTNEAMKAATQGYISYLSAQMLTDGCTCTTKVNQAR